ncbi:hypothetical protein ACJMK2_030014 [Sinanodonta woodiana]|uniref:BHLH domain-containing protein n=1 Tax=Sinanodonta woodiana TaxID=1069815 RepID=A0ABD3XFY5_SINWO
MATTVGFIPLQLIPTSIFNIDKLAANGTYVVVKTPTVAQQIQLSKSLKEGRKQQLITIIAASQSFCGVKDGWISRDANWSIRKTRLSQEETNERRRRVKMVNLGFETLRQHVPSGKKNKKMSKVETLRSACEYIKQLQDLLNGDADDGTDTSMTDLLNNSLLQNHQVKDLISSMVNNNNMVINNNSLVDNSNNVMSPAKPLATTTIQTTDSIQDTVNSEKNDLDYSVQVPVSPTASVPSPVASCPSNTSETMSPSYSQTDAYSQTFGTQGIYANLSSKSYYQTVNFQGNYTQSNSYTQQQVYTHTSSGSLHSPTPSMSSDASYDSFSQEKRICLASQTGSDIFYNDHAKEYWLSG